VSVIQLKTLGGVRQVTEKKIPLRKKPDGAGGPVLTASMLTRTPGLAAGVVGKVERQGLLSSSNSVMGLLAAQLSGDDVLMFKTKVDYMTAVSERLGEHRPLKTNARTVMADAGPFFGVTKRARTGVDASYPSGDQLRGIIGAYTGDAGGPTPPISMLLQQIDAGMSPKGSMEFYVPLAGVHADVETSKYGETRKVELQYASIIQKNPLAVAAAVLDRAKATQAAAIEKARAKGGDTNIPLVIETDAVKELFPVWHGKEPLTKQLEAAPPVQLEDAKRQILEGKLGDARATLAAIDPDDLGAESRTSLELAALKSTLANPATLGDPKRANALASALCSRWHPKDKEAFKAHVHDKGLTRLKGFVGAADKGRTATMARLGRGKYNQVLHQHANVVAKLAVQLAATEIAQDQGKVSAGIMGGTVNAGKGYCLKASDDARAQYGGLDLVFDCAGEQNSIEMPWLRAFLDDLHERGEVTESPKMTAIFVDKDYRTTWMHEEFSVLHRGTTSGRTPHAADVLDASIFGPSNFATFYLNECLPRGDTDAIVLGYGKGGKPFAHPDAAKFCLNTVEHSVARLMADQQEIVQDGKEAFTRRLVAGSNGEETVKARGEIAESKLRHWLMHMEPSLFEDLEDPAKLEQLSAALEPFDLHRDSEVWRGLARSPRDRDELLRAFGGTLRLLREKTVDGPDAAVASLLEKADGVHAAAGDARVCTLSSKGGLEARVDEMHEWAETAEVAKSLRAGAPWVFLSSFNRLDAQHGGQWRDAS